MQSDMNNFCGDVVFDGFKKATRDEDNILRNLKKQRTFHNILRKCLLSQQ